MDISFLYQIIDTTLSVYQEQQQCTVDEAGRVFLSEVGQLLTWLSSQQFDDGICDLVAAYAQRHQDRPMVVILEDLIRQAAPMFSSVIAVDTLGQ